MSAFTMSGLLSVEDYLDAEKFRNAKHEYMGGRVYTLAGASRIHNRITGNFAASLHGHLRGSSNEVYAMDVRVRLLNRLEDVFYYPDLVVTCDPRETEGYYLRFPKLVVEVLSEFTARCDLVEKRNNYVTIPTLEEYVLVSHDKPLVTILRRRADWEREYTFGLDSFLHLESVDFTLPLWVLYENVRGIA